MSKIDFDYEIDTDTDKQGGGGGIIPHGYYRAWAEAIDFPETKDKKGRQAAITFEIQEPEEWKGRKWWEYWTVVHADGFQNGSYKYGKPKLDCFGRAVGVVIEKGTDSDDLLFKSFVAEVVISEGQAKNDGSGDKYKDKNQIRKFFYEDDQAKEPVPELGVIGDGTMPARAEKKTAPAANDNKPAATATAGAAPAKKLPWGKKAA
ncbi:hypothetical protein LB533_20530 [Mesorhizobium sp. BR1-1-13]|uniref:hypothetical protein n=1 Tax=Mesorhizobium sp. BR1-1-13 TaxID=2876656 RepID=UPI001CD1161C|nr:hypothetical protein [Mesorhizobium sp. BR1-1-13]MBZ9943476.1 hypothetical protein [Mesorhizobium sp. BR1-1-13]